MKTTLLVSVSANLIIGVMLYLAVDSNSANARLFSFCDESYLDDVSKLEVLLKGRLSKDEALSLIESSFAEDEYFRKPAENGLGLGRLFLVFDDKGQLKQIDAYSFEGP